MFDPTKCESVSMAQAKAQEEQNPVSAALRATSIAFVTLAESGQIDDTTATENVTQFAPWAYPVVFGGGIYDILDIDHMNYKKKCIKFKCRKARR